MYVDLPDCPKEVSRQTNAAQRNDVEHFVTDFQGRAAASFAQENTSTMQQSSSVASMPEGRVARKESGPG
jgi:hypothetical protein